MWLLEDAAGGNAADQASQLQRGGRDGTLTSRNGNRFARVPLPVKHALHPLLGRHESSFLGGKVDSGPVSDTQFISVIREPVDSELHASRVEKNVTGMQDGFMKIHHSVRRS